MPVTRDVNDLADRADLRFFVFEIGAEIFFASADHSHETDAIALRHRARPTFQLHETPHGKIADLSSLLGLDGNQILFYEPLGEVLVDGNVANQLRQGLIERLLMAKGCRFLAVTDAIDRDPHRAIHSRLFRDRRATEKQLGFIRHDALPLRNRRSLNRATIETGGARCKSSPTIRRLSCPEAKAIPAR